MRFKLKPEPMLGDIKIIRRFLWLPTVLDTDELRWLERAYIQCHYGKKHGICGDIVTAWIEDEWADPNQQP